MRGGDGDVVHVPRRLFLSQGIEGFHTANGGDCSAIVTVTVTATDNATTAAATVIESIIIARRPKTMVR
jgi:hypothetical protein